MLIRGYEMLNMFRMVVVVILLLVGAAVVVAHAAPPSKAPALAPLAWYDANGKLVGRNTTMPPNYNPWVAFPCGDDLVPLRLDEETLYTGGMEFGPEGSVYFSLSNCTGVAYLNEGTRRLVG